MSVWISTRQLWKAPRTNAALRALTAFMTFICNHRGVVYEKNLGKDTFAIAERMTRYNPDTSWKKIDE